VEGVLVELGDGYYITSPAGPFIYAIEGNFLYMKKVDESLTVAPVTGQRIGPGTMIFYAAFASAGYTCSLNMRLMCVTNGWGDPIEGIELALLGPAGQVALTDHTSLGSSPDVMSGISNETWYKFVVTIDETSVTVNVYTTLDVLVDTITINGTFVADEFYLGAEMANAGIALDSLSYVPA
jgi:hypothetical protein